jgi:hypothetical protein
LQVPFMQRAPSQEMPHPPQLFRSFLGLTHTSRPASVDASPVQSKNPPGQAHMLALQTMPGPQALPHPPQFWGSDVMFVHTGGLPHARVFCGQTHLAPVQMVPPVQATPQAPQLPTSD